MTTIKIEGMSCQHCVRAVQQALEDVPGVDKVDVRLDENRAVVEGSADVAALVAAVNEEGYTASAA